MQAIAEPTLLDKIKHVINYNPSFPIPIKHKWLGFINRTAGWLHIKNSIVIRDDSNGKQIPNKVEEIRGWSVWFTRYRYSILRGAAEPAYELFFPRRSVDDFYDVRQPPPQYWIKYFVLDGTPDQIEREHKFLCQQIDSAFRRLCN